MTLAFGTLLALAGCTAVQEHYDSKLTLETPVDWWHRLQGGTIAEDRPPPPGVNDPYPNLGQVPARPTPTDATTRRALSARLAAERDRATRAAAQDPITPPKPPGAAPAPPPAAPPPRDPGASVAVLDGATPPPSPAAAPPPAPAAPPPPAAFTAPPRRPPGPAASANANNTGNVPAAPPAAPAEAAPIPPLPGQPPPIPSLSGMPATTTAPATPRPLPSVSVAFARGSATLPAAAEAALQALAARRGGGPVVVMAGGDAGSAAPDAQAAALPLALRRARAVAGVLLAAGVPQAALRTDATGLGRGASARLVD